VGCGAGALVARNLMASAIWRGSASVSGATPGRPGPVSGWMPASTITSATWIPWGRSSRAAALLIALTPNDPAAQRPRLGHCAARRSARDLDQRRRASLSEGEASACGREREGCPCGCRSPGPYLRASDVHTGHRQNDMRCRVALCCFRSLGAKLRDSGMRAVTARSDDERREADRVCYVYLT
jgi:hypothetical protein